MFFQEESGRGATFLWHGACGGVWAEGPHLYKRDGRYYLMVAEGGTSFYHAVMIAVSDNITGPYTCNPRNPIMTSLYLSDDNWLNSTGHADMLFERTRSNHRIIVNTSHP